MTDRKKKSRTISHLSSFELTKNKNINYTIKIDLPNVYQILKEKC